MNTPRNANHPFFVHLRRWIFAIALCAAPIIVGMQLTPARVATASASDSGNCILLAGTNDKCPVWTAKYDNPNGHGTLQASDELHATAVSQNGDRVYVTGVSWNNVPGKDEVYGPAGTMDFLTAAYDSATGAQLWTARYNGPENGDDTAFNIAVSPDGTRVYVVGATGVLSSQLQSRFGIVAYDSATGAQLWTRAYAGPGRGGEFAGNEARSVAVSSDGLRLYVGGTLAVVMQRGSTTQS